MVVIMYMEMTEAENIDPNQGIEMVTVSIETDSINLSSVQQLGRNVTNVTS